MNCPICDNGQADCEQERDYKTIKCPRCGNFLLESYPAAIDLTLQNTLKNDSAMRALLSHNIRRSLPKSGSWKMFNSGMMNNIKEKTLPNVFEKCDYALEWIGNNSQYAGDKIELKENHLLELEAFSGAKERKELTFCLNSLVDSGLIAEKTSSRYTVTFEGWKRYDELTKGKLSYNKAFMAMKYNDTALDEIFRTHFKPAVTQTGYELLRLNEKLGAGLIDIRMRQEIKTSKFVICDLTHGNQGAYWEAGFAEGIGKPVIYTCEKSHFETEKTHFDVNHHLTIMWEEGKEEQAANDLKAAIRFTFPEAKQQDSEDAV